MSSTDNPENGLTFVNLKKKWSTAIGYNMD